MNNLTNGKIIPTIPSYEVAKMMEREHRDVLRMLEGCEKPKIVGIIPTLKQMVELPLADYFIESSYNDRGRELKCYECTKMGCELLANKLTGEKGILFSAKYVKIFNEMELEKEQLQLTNEDKAILNIIHAGDNLSRTLAIQEYKNVITEPLLNQIEELSPLAQKYNIFIDTEGLTNIDTFSKDLNIKKLGRNNMYKYLRNKGLLRKDNKPYQKYIDSGWFTVKPCGNHISNNEIIQDYKTYLTANGVNKIIDELIKDGYINISS